MTGSRRTRWLIGLAVAVPILAVAAGLVGRSLWWSLRPTPDFPTLAAAPDRSRVGTIAYIGPYPDDGCVWAVRAADGSARRVGCVDGSVGRLSWRADGRLEGTRFVRSARGDSEYRWVADVAGGGIEDVPGSRGAPSKGDTGSEPAGPNGERAVFRSARGRLTVTIIDRTGRRASTAVAAPDTYTFGQIAWSPDGAYLCVHDDLDRVLLITNEREPRILEVADHGWGPAVTAIDALAEPTGTP